MMGPILSDTGRVGQLCGLAVCLVCLAGPAAAQEPAAALALPPEILDTTWEWTGFQTPKEEIVVADPSSYTLTFAADGAVALQVDCNRGVTSYVLSEDNRITFDPIATTMMMCEGDSLDHAFTTNLERVNSFFPFEGDLLLEQPFDSGTLRFRPASTEASTEPGTSQ